MLINVTITGYSSFDLVLVRWYGFRNARRLYKYDCPLLQYMDIYNFVLVKSIIELVQIFKHAEKQNEYFVNTFMF